MSLLTIIQNAARRIGLTPPSAVIGSTDIQVLELLSFAQQSGGDLMREHDWTELLTEHSFTTVAADAQTSSIPSDFDRFVNGSMFNRSTNRQVVGPISIKDWQWRKAQTAAETVEDYFRVRGGTILMTPQPAAGESVYYEYVSNKWCEDSGGTAQSAWSADTDVGRIDEELITRDVVWRWKKAKGLAWEVDLASRDDLLSRLASRDGGAPTLTAGSRLRQVFNTNIQDGSFPSS